MNERQISQDSNAPFKYYQSPIFLTCHNTTTLLHAFVAPLAFKLPIRILYSPSRSTHVTANLVLTCEDICIRRRPVLYWTHGGVKLDYMICGLNTASGCNKISSH